MSSQYSIVIPNYNGVGVIEECLAAVAGSPDVVVVDDASSDDSVNVIGQRFPAVRVKRMTKNRGFSAAVNEGITLTESDLIVLLNNDVEVTPGFMDSILPLFDDESVFAVSPRILLPKRGNIDEGAKTGFWHHGIFFTDQRQDVSEVRPILYTTGCAAIYRRSMLEELGRFDEAYSPFYWEDVDLGYRAWKRGWKSLYQSASTVYHQHSSSISRINSDYTSRVKARNSLFFIWRNIDDAALLSNHSRWLPFVVARRGMGGDMAFVKGWRDAFLRRDEAVEARYRDAKHRMMSDREIFAHVGIEV